MPIDLGALYQDENYRPTSILDDLFQERILTPTEQLPETQDIYSMDRVATFIGRTKDFIRNNVIGLGQADFTTSYENITPDQKVTLYCFFNMRKHLMSQFHIFNLLHHCEQTQHFMSENFYRVQTNNITFLDIGCGPLTAGWAYSEFLRQKVTNHNLQFDYVGIDIAQSMIDRATEFSNAQIFNTRCSFDFCRLWTDDQPYQILSDEIGSMLINFSYLFANLNQDQALSLANFVNELNQYYPHAKMIMIYQNPPLDRYHRTYNVFKRHLNNIETLGTGNNVVNYYSRSYHRGHTTAQVYFEVLANSNTMNSIL